MEPKIIYEDSDLLVLEKPAGDDGQSGGRVNLFHLKGVALGCMMRLRMEPKIIFEGKLQSCEVRLRCVRCVSVS